MFNTMRLTGPTLTDKDVNNLESNLGAKLPDQYKDFLLQYNGGEPVENTIKFGGESLNISGASIGYFYGVGLNSENIEETLSFIDDDIPEGLIPIADTPSGNYFLLSLRDDESYGKIYYKDHEYEYDEEEEPFNEKEGLLPNSIVKVSEDFSDFLDRLYDIDAP